MCTKRQVSIINIQYQCTRPCADGSQILTNHDFVFTIIINHHTIKFIVSSYMWYNHYNDGIICNRGWYLIYLKSRINTPNLLVIGFLSLHYQFIFGSEVKDREPTECVPGFCIILLLTIHSCDLWYFLLSGPSALRDEFFMSVDWRTRTV